LPGTSYGFLNDPVFGNIREPELGGITIYPNVALGVITPSDRLIFFLWLKCDRTTTFSFISAL
jgi:hypothetical protein